MNKQEVIQTLKKYRSLHAECDRLRQRIVEKRHSMYDIRAVVTNSVNVKSGEIADRVERVVEMMESAVGFYTYKLEQAEESERRILELLEKITDNEERNVIFMHYIEGKTFLEISDVLYMSERTVCTRHKTAIEGLCHSCEGA
ncbi:MAG: sigma-70 family RNA polymerase sigma factor [Clostridia bacterium]|nr:sigma-70 family RNA polymerase sigma factor [Clostridia bacterium]